MPSFMERMKTSYNVLVGKEPEVERSEQITSISPSAAYYIARRDTVRAILAPIKTRIAIDAANIAVKHVLVDDEEKFIEVKKSELNDRLTIMANIDQPGTAFMQDVYMTMLEAGSCVLVPIEVSTNPATGSYDVLSMRVGTVVEWFNQSVMVEVYNELKGDRTQKMLPKSFVAIAYNPMYAVMNEANSTLNRLIDRLVLLDVADSSLFSPQLDLILQLPFALKSDKKVAEANRRLEDIQAQLNDSKYGIAYIDAAEGITQLNRPVTNELFNTVESLTKALYAQLGLTDTIFAGSASQEEVLAYNNRTILPIVKAITESMTGAFFSRTAIRQGNRIMAFPNLFKMAPLESFAEAADKLTRNAIMSSNEIRAVVGLQASDQEDADALRNKNLNVADNMQPGDQSQGAPQPGPQPGPQSGDPIDALLESLTGVQPDNDDSKEN